VNFVALWLRNGSFQRPQSFQFLNRSLFRSSGVVMNFRWRLKECCQMNKRQGWDICNEFSMWHFVTKSTGLKSAKPGMSIHFSELGDPIYVGSAMCPECRRKDWRSKSCWLHPQESDPEVVQGPGSRTISPISLGPAVVLIQGNWHCYWSWPTLVPPDVAASATLPTVSPHRKVGTKMSEWMRV